MYPVGLFRWVDHITASGMAMSIIDLGGQVPMILISFIDSGKQSAITGIQEHCLQMTGIK